MKRRAEYRRKWTPLDTSRLISEFESMPFLWNFFDEEYKNKRLRSTAIEKLASDFDTSPREIHRKLHNLRCQFTSEIRKLKSRSGAVEQQQSQWSHFDSLKFLFPVINVRSTEGNDVATSLSCYEPGTSENSPAVYSGGAYSEEEQEGSGGREVKFNPLDLEFGRNRSDSTSDFSEANDRKNTPSEGGLESDDFEIFGKLIATNLRKMPLQRAIRCQEKLFTVIMGERMAAYESPPDSKGEEKVSIPPTDGANSS